MSDPKVKTFDAAVIGSITSGVLMVEPFSKVHEAIEWLAGEPIFTHQLPLVSELIGQELMTLYPQLPDENLGGRDWNTVAKWLNATFPDGLTFVEGQFRQ